MLLMTLAGGYAFSHEVFMEGESKSGRFVYVLNDMLNILKKDFRLIKPKVPGAPRIKPEIYELKDVTFLN